MKCIDRVVEDGRVQAALHSFHQNQKRQLELIARVQQIPAPTFAEAQRAQFVHEQFLAAGLVDVHQDALSNVYGRLPGAQPGPPLIVSAHLDTVFPPETDLTIKRNGRLLYGPGIGDNATGVAGLILVAQAMLANQLQPKQDVWFVANVCEEGLGDLQGMRAVVDQFGDKAVYIVVEGGLYGQISHEAIGVSRHRITVTGPGGHSWGSFGAPSAIHILAKIVTAIDAIRPAAAPRTSYNVGTIEGGSSINTIAQSASLQLDLRSENVAALDALVNQVRIIVAETAYLYLAEGVDVEMTQIGQRPAGSIPRETDLVQLALAALAHVGCPDVTFMRGSTDANVPLSRGITAVCIGLTQSGNAHRTDEYIDPLHLPHGLGQLLLLILAAAEFG
jgi:tripeptide aminopeptidase